MLEVGLTGGIASGKSLVAEMFERLGAPAIDADVASRAVVAPGSDGLAAVVEAFGEEVLDARGELDRRALRERVFADPSARQRLESILHPRIRAWMDAAAEELRGEGHPYLLRVIPLLVETGRHTEFERVLVVDAPESLQRARLLQRDGMGADAASAALAAQAKRWERLKCASDVVINGDEVPPDRGLFCQVRALDRKFRHLAR